MRLTIVIYLTPIYLYIHEMNFALRVANYETDYCNLQGHSSLTPIYLYIHEMNVALRVTNYETDYCNLQGHSSLTSIYLYIHKMNFDILINSYPKLAVTCKLWCWVSMRSLNYISLSRNKNLFWKDFSKFCVCGIVAIKNLLFCEFLYCI